MSEIINVPEIFGKNVFNDKAMQERLPKSVYKKLKKTIEDGAELDPSIADVVAHAMKDWAIERGATHYSHWFQPLTGITAEKHDAFISVPDSNGRVIMEFSGKELIKGEPDASSFPSGGLRSTFEARGYTTWDCTSPAFLREDTLGVTLYIPTAFCSYRGEALDKKTPLLRSMQAINEQALRILRLFGNTTSHRVIPYVGPEQEYFLVDKNKYLQRKDLIYTGRTLFGAMPPKGQEMDDHYFGSIRPRVGAFMKELNETLWRLGVSAKTQHNEVAPAQHEIDFKYDNALRTADNILTFKFIVKYIAKRHGLYASFMPKPITGVDGSGMHLNMSLWKNGKNIFADSKNDLGISEEAFHFMAGVMEHANEMCLITNPLVNSYKRIVPGYEAPVDVSWSPSNRSPLIRVPAARGSGTRIEFRSPDSAANPYLALAVSLAAGLDGIKRKLTPGKGSMKNQYEMAEGEKQEAGINTLPRDMKEALEIFKQSAYMKELLGDHIFNKYVEAKSAEWESYQQFVSQWEVDHYLYKI